MTKQLEKYTKAYEKQKGNRTLCWKPHLGTVNLEIELSDERVVEVTTTPARAALIWNFQMKSKLAFLQFLSGKDCFTYEYMRYLSILSTWVVFHLF